MNFDHCNKTYEYIKTKLFPHVTIRANFIKFEDYLTAFSELPSGKWLRNEKSVILMRTHFLMNTEEFAKDYAKYCVSFYFIGDDPTKITYRIIYQVSPELHLEVFVFTWMEKETVFSFAIANVVMKYSNKFIDFLKTLEKYKLTGNTSDASPLPGFLQQPK